MQPARLDKATEPASARNMPSRRLDRQSAPTRIQSPAITILLLLAAFYTAYFAAVVVVPVTAALLLYFLLSPVVAALTRLRLPRALASVLVIVAVVAAAVGPLYVLTEPAAEWLRAAPTSVNELREKFRTDESNPLADARAVSDALEEAVDDISGSDESDAEPAVQIREPGLLDSVLTMLPLIAASSLVAIVLALFLLISGESLLRKLTAMGTTFTLRKRIVVIVRQIEREIARYLGTVTIVNCALGCVVAGAMYFAGLPNPLLWGAVAGILNYAPYLGPAVTSLVILLAAATTFETTGEILAPPLLFIAITALEGQVVTPMLLGQRLQVSPFIVLTSVLVFGWMWGLVGALMAVPIVASARIVLIHVPRLRALGMLLAK